MAQGEFYDNTFSTTSVTVTICASLALYNSLELLLLIFTTFKSYRGLYFWSLVVATTGVILYSIGLILFYFQLTDIAGSLVLINCGWWTMVTGESVVLYSRLGLVLDKSQEKILRAVKWMIAVDAILFHVTTTVVSIGSYYASDARIWSQAYDKVEKIQMTGFCAQEFIISGLYLWKTFDLIRLVSLNKKRATDVLRQLFAINVVIILLDVALLVIEYMNLRIDEFTFKALSYSVKLKLEFAILGKLVEFSGGGGNGKNNYENLTMSPSLNDSITNECKHKSLKKTPDFRNQGINDYENGKADHVEASAFQFPGLTVVPSQTGQSITGALTRTDMRSDSLSLKRRT